MKRLLSWLDAVNEIDQQNKIAVWLDRIIFVFLVLMALSAPHSISASQAAWLLGISVWFIRCLIKPRPRLFKTPLNLAFLSFFLWSLISSVLSYAPDISLDKLRGVGLVLVFFLVVNNLRTKKAVFVLAFALIFSCLFNVGATLYERVTGRGVEIVEIDPQSPLILHIIDDVTDKLFIEPVHVGDTLVAIGKRKISSPEDILSEVESKGAVKIKIYHDELYMNIDVAKVDLLPGETAAEKLGIITWKRNYNWRAQGFFGHFTTYAEALQLISALIFGLLIAALTTSDRRKMAIVLGIVLAAFLFALLLTVTRASQAAFLVSSLVVALIGTSRRTVLALLIVSVPVALIGLYVLQKSRNIGVNDSKDNSAAWRQTVYREGFDLATSSPRHLVVGVGMDSIKRYAKEWHLFDDGRLPMGHFHSTPLQLLVERGLPALLIWLWILWLFGSSIWRKLRSADISDWREKGILLGGFGALIGFFVSGIVHYNLGDGEVAMVFYLIMGLSIVLTRNLSQMISEPSQVISNE